MYNSTYGYLDQLKAQSKEALEMAEQHGVDTTSGKAHNNKTDAFRHAYISAKQTRDNGSLRTNVLGKANELKGAIFYGQSSNEWKMDEHNNRVGRAIGQRAKNEG